MNRSSANLHRLIYVSRTSGAIRATFEDELKSIVDQSEIDNRARDVTGVLITHDGWFVQALEGDHDIITSLYDRIARDPRHEKAKIVSLEAVTGRLFGAWGMCAGQPPSADATQALNMRTFSATVLLNLLNKSVEGSEPNRHGALKSLAILEALPEQQFDDIVQVAKSIARTEVAEISLVEVSRQKSTANMSADSGQHDAPFDKHVVLGSETMWVEDALLDGRFNEMPGGAPSGVRFYAGAPLDVGGIKVGVLSVMGPEPRAYDPVIASGLEALGRSVSARLEARREERIAASLLSSASDAIICVDDERNTTFFNAAAEAMFGYSTREMLGRPLEIIVPERLRSTYNATFAEAKSLGHSPFGGRSIEAPGMRKDGSEFPMEIAVAVWAETGGMGAGVIIRDCSERNAAIRSLAEAKQAAETANVAKSVFLANMSHEIRTPLNGVIGVTDLLTASGLNPQQAEMAELIRASGEQLHGLLGDILDIARIEAGEMVLDAQVISIKDLMRSIVQLYANAADQKGLRLETLMGEGCDQPVIGDPVRLKQILSNLVSNAVKFTPTGSISLIARRIEPTAYEFVVADTGIGVDPALREQIFDRFQQADGSITRKFGGTGLGLSICRQLSTLMGGKITCDSQPGGGTSFKVQLPLQDACVAPPVSTIADAEASAPAERRLSVLMADDHAVNRRVVEMILSNLDIEIVSVEDGAEALAMFKAQHFDIILMDMMMPVMDGLAANRAIRQHERDHQLGRTPILMLTANVLPEHVRSALESGADRHIPKPITANKLISSIGEVLEEEPANDVGIALLS